MVCPKCGREMVAGFLQGDAKVGISWVSKLIPFGLGYWKNDTVLVSKEFGFCINAIPTHICKNCKILLGDYSHQK